MSKREPGESMMPTVIHVHHDVEAHARSFNEGYEAAVTQGLADDPSLADDWLQAKLREAKVEALREAAGLLDAGIAYGWDSDRQYGDWLRGRAEELAAEDA